MENANLAKLISIVLMTIRRVWLRALRSSFVTFVLKNQYALLVLIPLSCAATRTETAEILRISLNVTHSYRDVGLARVILLAKNLTNATVCVGSA